MPQITGKAVIRLDGSELRTTGTATLNPGGMNRETVKGGGVIHGYKEEDVEPSVECSVAHTTELSIKDLAAIIDATVMFETDSGAQFVLRNAWVTEPPSLDAISGEVDLKFAALSRDEVR